MGKVKQAQQEVFDICEALYAKLGTAGVCDHVNQELINRTYEYQDVRYEHCTGCDADMPSLGGTCLCCGQTVTPMYFKIVQQGWNKDLKREEVEINCGENGKLLLIKTEQGFIVDVYGQEKHICTNTVWEDDLEDNEEIEN